MDATRLARWTAARRYIQAMDHIRLLHLAGKATDADVEYVYLAREAFEHYDHPGIASELVGPLASSVSKPEYSSVQFH